MSRVGKYPVKVPNGVTITIDQSTITAKGKLGALTRTFNNLVSIVLNGDEVVVTPTGEDKKNRMMWGTARSIINGMVVGVSEGFKKELILQGVGYRAAMKGKDLELQLGFSHPILYAVPEGIKISCTSPTELVVSGFNKEAIGQVAAEIRSYRPPEPYKGKGVRYKDEVIVRKEGKKK